MRHVESVIIGQGLAGTTLAWQLMWRGHDFLVIDSGDEITCSRVAAGLMTPVTGQRLVPSARWQQCWPIARSFYDRVSEQTGARVFRQLTMLRLFVDHEEESLFRSRLDVDSLQHVRFPAESIDESKYGNGAAGFEMPEAGQLNVARYLDASRNCFEQHGCLLAASVDPITDVVVNEDGIRLPRWNVSADRVVWCRGFVDCDCPWFSELQWDSAKGEILRVRIPGLNEDRVIHRGLWIVRDESDIYRVGATYDRERLDQQTTSRARRELEQRLSDCIQLKFEVVDQAAAVRPILLGRHPLAGFSPRNPRIGCLNGLASKGSLIAPWMAEQLAAEICDGTPVPEEIGFRRWTKE